MQRRRHCIQTALPDPVLMNYTWLVRLVGSWAGWIPRLIQIKVIDSLNYSCLGSISPNFAVLLFTYHLTLEFKSMKTFWNEQFVGPRSETSQWHTGARPLTFSSLSKRRRGILTRASSNNKSPNAFTIRCQRWDWYRTLACRLDVHRKIVRSFRSSFTLILCSNTWKSGVSVPQFTVSRVLWWWGQLKLGCHLYKGKDKYRK